MLAARSSIWPPAMPPAPAARASESDIEIASSVGEDVEGQRQQRVAGEDRRRLVEGLVDRRPAAAEVVVVHRRQVVMDEAVGMDAFERRGGGDDRPRRSAPKSCAASMRTNGRRRLPRPSTA